MLTDIKRILDKARTGRYGVAGPTMWDERSLKACLSVAAQLRSPIVIGYVKGWGSEEIFESGRAFELIERENIPVALQQDHGSSFEENMWAIHAGFPAIAVDRPHSAYAENVAQTREMVKIAHATNVRVEAEIGHVGGTSEGDETVLTDPERARRYVEETGVDILAVSVGSIHGHRPQTIDVERIRKLREVVPIPLAVHGASGLGYENMSKMGGAGITKFNMQTHLSAAAIKALEEYLEQVRESPDHMKRQLKCISEAADRGWAEELARCIRALGSERKADQFARR